MFNPNPALALFMVRAVVGSVFVLHGSQKVFGILGGPGLYGYAAWLATLGIPSWLAYVGAFAELIGGLMVLLGIAPQLGAVVLMGDMITAIYLVHLPHGYFIQNNGWEYPFNLILLCLAIIIGGPGAYSLM